jgi:hypothetical protein
MSACHFRLFLDCALIDLMIFYGLRQVSDLKPAAQLNQSSVSTSALTVVEVGSD